MVNYNFISVTLTLITLKYGFFGTNLEPEKTTVNRSLVLAVTLK